MNKKIIKQLARELRQANEEKVPCSPLREILGLEDIATAYAIQDINNQKRIKAGARITGRKIGLTSPAVQKQLGVNQPDYGLLLDTMEVLNNTVISMQELMQPKVEGEIAFVLGKNLPKRSITIAELIRAIDFVLPSIEIIGSRIKDWDIRITDTIADNASASHYVVGHTPVKMTTVDLVNCKMQLKKNGKIVSKGTGANCMGSPLNAMLWLANKMAELGSPLKKGETILSGSLGPVIEVDAGDSFTATFTGLGAVNVSFTD